MNSKVTCILNITKTADYQALESFRHIENISKIIAVSSERSQLDNIEFIDSKATLEATETWKILVEKINTDFTLVYTKMLPLRLGQNSLERMMHVAEDTGAGMVYADYFEKKQGELKPHPVIEYQEGSLRDDFNFGSILLYKTSALKEAVVSMDKDYQFAALYDLRLKVSQNHTLVHLPELLYTEIELDTRKSGEKMFDYVDPRNRERQIEMEQACTEHLKIFRCLPRT
jgi:hypothetical protein